MKLSNTSVGQVPSSVNYFYHLDMQTTSEQVIRASKIIAIIRGDYSLQQLIEIAHTLSEGGVKAVEVTLNSTDALEGITALRKSVSADMVVGAGTVRTAEQVTQSIDAGAQFLISPNFDPASVAVSQAVSRDQRKGRTGPLQSLQW